MSTQNLKTTDPTKTNRMNWRMIAIIGISSAVLTGLASTALANSGEAGAPIQVSTASVASAASSALPSTTAVESHTTRTATPKTTPTNSVDTARTANDTAKLREACRLHYAEHFEAEDADIVFKLGGRLCDSEHLGSDQRVTIDDVLNSDISLAFADVDNVCDFTSLLAQVGKTVTISELDLAKFDVDLQDDSDGFSISLDTGEGSMRLNCTSNAK